VNCNYFIPNVFCQQAYWLNWKIFMRFAAGCSAVTKKRKQWSGQKKYDPLYVCVCVCVYIYNANHLTW
jgi:uncharacterized membrane protein SirB2